MSKKKRISRGYDLLPCTVDRLEDLAEQWGMTKQGVIDVLVKRAFENEAAKTPQRKAAVG